MVIKEFTEQDISLTAKFCRENMHLDIMPDFLLKEKTIGDSDFRSDLTLLAFEENAPVGFIQGLIREREQGKVGYIKLLAVQHEYRRKEIGSKLYNLIEDKFIQENIKQIRVYETYPNYFMPGVDPFYTEAVAFFERHKFKKFNDTSNLVSDLTNQNFSTEDEENKLLNDNIVCRRASIEDKKAIIEWTEKNFKAWIGEISEAFNNSPVSLFIAELNGKVEAFSAYEVNNKGTGWFGPMGTTSNLRGKGIGGILLKKCLLAMKEIGFNKAIIPWVGPIPFYLHYCNAKVSRVFWRYEKFLE